MSGRYHISFGLAVLCVSIPNALGCSRLFPGLCLLCSLPQFFIALQASPPSDLMEFSGVDVS